MLSVIATSTYCPCPVARACHSAAIVPNAANRPGTVSPAPPPTFTGCPASVPVMPIQPPIACATMSNDGHIM